MRYVVNTNHGAEISLTLVDSNTVELEIDGSGWELNIYQFKDLRKDVGYVWQEVEHADS